MKRVLARQRRPHGGASEPMSEGLLEAESGIYDRRKRSREYYNQEMNVPNGRQ
jgi:hypothetical protein